MEAIGSINNTYTAKRPQSNRPGSAFDRHSNMNKFNNKYSKALNDFPSVYKNSNVNPYLNRSVKSNLYKENTNNSTTSTFHKNSSLSKLKPTTTLSNFYSVNIEKV